MSWPLVELGKVCSRVSVGHVGKTSEYYTDKTGIPFLRTQNVSQGGLKLDDVMFVTKEFHEKLKKSQLKTGDVILSRVISSRINCAVVPENFGEANCANIILARPYPEKLDSSFLLHYLKSETAQRLLLGRQVGSAQSVVNTGVLKSWVIPLPPLPEQKRIAAILDKADQLRQKRQQAITLADDFLRSVFLDMFGDPVTNPKGWEVKSLANLVTQKGDMVDGPFGSSVNTKVDYVEHGEIPVIRTKNISKDGEFLTDDLKFMTREKYEDVKRSQVLPGDIVLTKVGTIGNVCIFPDTYPEAVLSTTGSCRIRIDENKVNKLYLYFFLKYYKPKMLEIASAGVQPFLNMKHIKGFIVPLPDIEFQKKFSSLVSRIGQLKNKHFQTVEQPLFNSLSQKAFAGEL